MPPSLAVRELAVPHALELVPTQHTDPRGVFLEWFRQDALEHAIGHPLALVQANSSVSRRGTLRGVHFADVPPGQGKYVTCVRGAGMDVVVDLRVGSPTFGTWDVVHLDDVERRAVYIPEGLGHAFLALDDDTTILYLCSEAYAPGREHAVNPLDPDLAITWPPDVAPLLSEKDAGAPGLTQARDSGLLPSYAECLQLYDRLAAGPRPGV